MLILRKKKHDNWGGMVFVKESQNGNQHLKLEQLPPVFIFLLEITHLDHRSSQSKVRKQVSVV